MVLRELINLIGFEIDEAAYSEVEGRSKALFDKIESVGKEMSIKVTAPIMAAAAFAVNEFTSYKTALAIVAQTIQSTGGAAGKTADELDKMSTSLEGQSLFAHDKILKDVTGTMLTFDKVTGSTFDRASKAAIDLAARWGIDLQSAALMVGKALNDPAEGLAMLTRRYVHMTKAEKEHIKALVDTGRTAEAQKYILDMVDRSVGGMAKTIRDSSSGFIVFRNKLMEVGTTFGEILQPYFKKFYDMLVKVLDEIENFSPATKKVIIGVAGIAAIIGPALVAFGAFGNLIISTSRGLGVFTKVFKFLAPLLTGGGLAALGGILAPLAAILALLVGIALAVEEVIVFFMGGETAIGHVLADIYNLMATVGDALQAWVNKAIANAIKWFKDGIAILYNMAIAWIDGVIAAIVNKIKSVPLVGTWLRGVESIFGGGAGAGAVAQPGAQAAWNMLTPKTSPATGAINKNLNVDSTIAMTVPAGTQQQQIQAVKSAAEQAVKFEWDKIFRQTYLQVQQ